MRIKTLFTIFAAIAALSASAQTGSEPQAGDIVRQGNSIYYLVRVFATPEQNAAFQRDIDIMRRHATAIDKCKLRIKEITDAEKTFEKDPKKLEALAADKARISSALDNLDEAPALLWAALNRERSLTADCRLEVEDVATGSTVVARSSGGPDAASALDELDCGRWKLVCDRPADSQRRRIFHIFEGADSALSGLGDAEVTHDVEVARITTYHGSRVVRLALPEMDIDYDFELPAEDIATLRGIAA